MAEPIKNMMNLGTQPEQIRTQAERAKTSGELAIHASEVSYRRFFEAARDGILILDADTGRINDVNPFLVELLGFARSEMIGKTVGELSPFKDIEPNKVMLERLQKEGFIRHDCLPVKAADGRRALLLPAIEGVDSVAEQLEITRRKAGIRPEEPIEIQRFSARSFEEPPRGARP